MDEMVPFLLKQYQCYTPTVCLFQSVIKAYILKLPPTKNLLHILKAVYKIKIRRDTCMKVWLKFSKHQHQHRLNRRQSLQVVTAGLIQCLPPVVPTRVAA